MAPLESRAPSHEPLPRQPRRSDRRHARADELRGLSADRPDAGRPDRHDDRGRSQDDQRGRRPPARRLRHRQAPDRALPRLGRAGAAGQFRLLALVQPAGAGGAVAAPAQHAGPGGDRLRAGHRHRPAARHLGGRPAAQPRRLSDQPALLRRHLRPALLARPAADHPVRGHAGLAAGRRHGRHPAGHALARRAGRALALSRPAGGHADPASSSAPTRASCAAR